MWMQQLALFLVSLAIPVLLPCPKVLNLRVVTRFDVVAQVTNFLEDEPKLKGIQLKWNNGIMCNNESQQPKMWSNIKNQIILINRISSKTQYLPSKSFVLWRKGNLSTFLNIIRLVSKLPSYYGIKRLFQSNNSKRATPVKFFHHSWFNPLLWCYVSLGF